MLQPNCTRGEIYAELDPTKLKRVCSRCPSDTYQTSPSHRDTECIEQPTCTAGQYSSPGSTTSALTCTDCPPNTFQLATSHRETSCTTQFTCSRGQYMTETTNDNEQRSCLPCPSNTFQDLRSHREPACVMQPNCTSGQYISADSLLAKRSCISCTDYTFQPLESHQAMECTPTDITTCSDAGYFNFTTGDCDCNGPETGVGASCEFNNKDTCNDNGEAQPDGSCDCYGPETGLGSTCNEYSNAKTCSNAGIVSAVEVKSEDVNQKSTWSFSCECTGSATGVGPTCSEYSDSAICNGAFKVDPSLGYGTALPDGTCTDCPESAPSAHSRNPKDCSCPLGYAGAMCDVCAPSYNNVGEFVLLECQPGGNVIACSLGEFFDASIGICNKCRPGFYADGTLDDSRSPDNGIRLECKACPSVASTGGLSLAQASPEGAVSVAYCYSKYQIGNPEHAFCYGKGFVQDAQDDAAEAEIDAGDAGDDATLVGGNSKAEDAALQHIVDGPAEQVGTACQAATKALGFTFAGVRAPPRGCVADPVSKTAWHYLYDNQYSLPHVADVEYELLDLTEPSQPLVPVCERKTCGDESGVQERVVLTKDDPPDRSMPDECKARVEAVNDALAIEKETNERYFYPIVAGAIVSLIVLAYMYLAKYQFKTTLAELPRSAHNWVWLGLLWRAFDIATDWGFYGVSLQSSAFVYACVDLDLKESIDADDGLDVQLKQACLAFSIIGTVLGPVDIWGAFQRLVNKKAEVAGWIVLLVSVCEDIPQLVLNGVFISTMIKYKIKLLNDYSLQLETEPDAPPPDLVGLDAISVLSLIGSVGNICYNIYFMISTYAVRSIAEKVEELTEANEALTGANEALTEANDVLTKKLNALEATQLNNHSVVQKKTAKKKKKKSTKSTIENESTVETEFKNAIGYPSGGTGSASDNSNGINGTIFADVDEINGGHSNSAALNHVEESDGKAYLNVVATNEVYDGFGQNGTCL